jgi:hypothetical protein
MIALPSKQYGLIFRLVEESDAAFILSLRTDPKLSRYLSPTGDALAAQTDWIRAYKTREAAGLEYYFLYADEAGERLGVFRLYNIADKTVTAGSWLARRDNDEFTAIKADLFLSTLIFKDLLFDKCLIDVRKENKKMVRYHRLFFETIREDEQDIYMYMDKELYLRKYEFLTSILNPK